MQKMLKVIFIFILIFSTTGCGLDFFRLPQSPSSHLPDYYLPQYANRVVSIDDAYDFDQSLASRAVNGVRGCGINCGSHDVYPQLKKSMILRWDKLKVTNGPGNDFVIFENGFRANNTAPIEHFMEQLVVYLSRDGIHWVVFPHHYQASDPSQYSTLPTDWIGFAGVNYILFHEENNKVDPFDIEKAGGDHFDISSIQIPTDCHQNCEEYFIKEHGFSYIKLVPINREINIDTKTFYPTDWIYSGPDIDGIYARYLEKDE